MQTTGSAPERVVLLLDGTSVSLRRIRPDDADRVRDLFARVSARSIYLRFHHRVARLSDDDLRRFTELDFEKRFGIAATVTDGDGEHIVGIGHYFEAAAEHAEVAFLVDDAHQGLGIATHILEELIRAGRDNGFQWFEAFVLSENRQMMEVFQATGLPVRSSLKYGTFFVEFPLFKGSPAATRRAHA